MFDPYIKRPVWIWNHEKGRAPRDGDIMPNGKIYKEEKRSLDG